MFIGLITDTRCTYRKKLMKALCKKVKVKYFGFHSLRRYGASKLAYSREPLQYIQKILGHSRVSTADLYLQSVSPEISSIKDHLIP